MPIHPVLLSLLVNPLFLAAQWSGYKGGKENISFLLSALTSHGSFCCEIEEQKPICSRKHKPHILFTV